MALNPNILLTNDTSNPLRIGKKISGQEDFLAPEFSCQKRGELLSVPQSSPVAFVCYCCHSFPRSQGKFVRRTHKTLLLPATSVLHSQCVIRIAGKGVHNAGFRT